MTDRVFNFSPGPAILPVPALEQAQLDLVAALARGQGGGVAERTLPDRSRPGRRLGDYGAHRPISARSSTALSRLVVTMRPMRSRASLTEVLLLIFPGATFAPGRN